MSWFIAIKHPVCFGYGADGHHSLVPAPAPCIPYLHVSNWAAPMHWVFGKYTDGKHWTDNLGTLLWGHDWGPLKVHLGTPNWAMAIIPLGACLKLQLPGATLQKPATMGVIHAGSSGPPAAAFAIGFIMCQSCWDISGFGFVMPTGFHFSAPTGEFVPVSFGCWVAAFACGLADSLFALAGSVFGAGFGRAWAGHATTAIMALLGTTFRTKLYTYLAMPLWASGAIVGGFWAELLVGAGGTTAALSALAACAAGLIMAPGLLLEYAGGAIVDEETGGPVSADGSPASSSDAPASSSDAPAADSGAPAADSGAPASSADSPSGNSDAGTDPPGGDTPPWEDGGVCEPDDNNAGGTDDGLMSQGP